VIIVGDALVVASLENTSINGATNMAKIIKPRPVVTLAVCAIGRDMAGDALMISIYLTATFCAHEEKS
jgi:hypothetical protein